MKVSRWIVPALVVLAAGGGIGAARLFAAPSLEQDFPAGARPSRPETVRLVVRGLKCVDTAKGLARRIEAAPGVVRLVAYAARNEAQVTYDAAVTDPAALCRAIEAPFYDAESGEILFHQFEVVAVDGRETR